MTFTPLLRRLVSPAGLTFAALVALSAAAVSVYQSCALYDSSLLLPAADAGADGGAEAGPCNPARWPSRPAKNDPSSTPNIEAVAALQSIDIGLGSSGDAGTDGGLPPYGFDLDGVCTCPGPPSCIQEQGAPETCDDSVGRDNANLEIFQQFGSVALNSASQLNQGLQSGQYGLVFRLTNYNNQPNDTQVTASLYVSNGVGVGADGGTVSPTHNGTDPWTIDPGSLANGAQLVGTDCGGDNPACVPVFTDVNAYVAGGVLVAQLTTDFPLSFGTKSVLGGAVMRLKDMLIVGTLQPKGIVGGGFGFAINDGTIAGRWPTSYLLSTLASMPDNNVPLPLGPDSYLCGQDKNYQILKWAACQIADIASNPAADNTNAHCDAISVGLRFTAEPARLGAVLAVPTPPAGCTTDAGAGLPAIPWSDQCSSP